MKAWNVPPVRFLRPDGKAFLGTEMSIVSISGGKQRVTTRHRPHPRPQYLSQALGET